MKKGFTLIEMLVVVLIIGILSAVALPNYRKSVEKARTAEAWTILKSINDAVKIKRVEDGRRKNATTNYKFKDLVIKFTDENGNTPTGSDFYTKYFHISDFGDNAFGAQSRADGYILFLRGNKRYCTGNSCKGLGFKNSVGSGASTCMSTQSGCYTD